MGIKRDKRLSSMTGRLGYRKGAEEMRERAAKHLETRADEIEAGEDPSLISRTMARIYRDEANLVRNLPIDPETGGSDTPRDAVREIDGPDGWGDPDEGAR